jgi:hypothetical protein
MVRSHVLYPAELRARPIYSLPACCSSTQARTADVQIARTCGAVHQKESAHSSVSFLRPSRSISPIYRHLGAAAPSHGGTCSADYVCRTVHPSSGRTVSNWLCCGICLRRPFASLVSLRDKSTGSSTWKNRASPRVNPSSSISKLPILDHRQKELTWQVHMAFARGTTLTSLVQSQRKRPVRLRVLPEVVFRLIVRLRQVRNGLNVFSLILTTQSTVEATTPSRQSATCLN